MISKDGTKVVNVNPVNPTEPNGGRSTRLGEAWADGYISWTLPWVQMGSL